MRHGRPNVLGDLVEQHAVAVEHAVHVADIASAEAARQNRGVAIEPKASTEPGVVTDVARALLEVAHQAAPLEHLGENVRGLLTRKVHATQLRHRVVAVFEEHLFVQLFSSLQTNRGIDGDVAGNVEIADELVEEETSQTLRAAAVASEQRSLHDLGKVDEREDGTIEIGEVATQNVGLGGGVFLWDIDRHGGGLYGQRRWSERMPLQRI